MSKHKIHATIPHGDPDIGAEVECDIVFNFTPGAGPTGPSYDSGGEPSYGAEVELVSVKANLLDMGAFQDLHQKDLEDLVSDWLQGDGYAEALAIAAEDDEAAREYAAELRADR